MADHMPEELMGNLRVSRVPLRKSGLRGHRHRTQGLIVSSMIKLVHSATVLREGEYGWEARR